jgi:hypothetical protein
LPGRRLNCLGRGGRRRTFAAASRRPHDECPPS